MLGAFLARKCIHLYLTRMYCVLGEKRDVYPIVSEIGLVTCLLRGDLRQLCLDTTSLGRFSMVKESRPGV